MFGFVVVDDGVIADVGNRLVVFVDGRILGVDIGQVGAVVLVDVAVPNVLVNGNAVGRLDCAFKGSYIDVYAVAFGIIGIRRGHYTCQSNKPSGITLCVTACCAFRGVYCCIPCVGSNVPIFGNCGTR